MPLPKEILLVGVISRTGAAHDGELHRRSFYGIVPERLEEVNPPPKP